MPGWASWLVVAAAMSVLLPLPLRVFLAGFTRGRAAAPVEPSQVSAAPDEQAAAVEPPVARIAATHTLPLRRVLLVDDDAALRLLLRTTLAADEFEVEEASGAIEAAALVRFRRPAAVILDVGLPDGDGLSFCRELKRAGNGEPPTVILLTGADTNEREATAAGADAFLRKPFSPLELLGLLDRLHAGRGAAFHEPPETDVGQLLLYARDLNQLLENERTQRRLLQQAYRQTTTALADALEAKDRRTGIHALRVQRYAVEIALGVDHALLDDSSLEYGFLLHDIGKIAIPDQVLNKPGPLTDVERELIQQHPSIGVEILQNVALLQGEGLSVVRSHHERWDGAGYPDGFVGPEIPLGARIFALADTLDAMTTDRPYRNALRWDEAIDEIFTQSGRQFDPGVVEAFAIREPRLRRLYDGFHEELPAASRDAVSSA